MILWHEGLLFKLKTIFPFTYYLILKSYLTDRYFSVSQGSAFSPYHPAKAGVPQGIILGPLLYTLYTVDVPVHPSTTFCSFADEFCLQISIPIQPQRSFSPNLVDLSRGVNPGGLNSTRLSVHSHNLYLTQKILPSIIP